MNKLTALIISSLAFLVFGCGQNFNGNYSSDYISIVSDLPSTSLSNEEGQTINLVDSARYSAEAKISKDNKLSLFLANVSDKTKTVITAPLDQTLISKIDQFLKAPFTDKKIGVKFVVPEGQFNLNGYSLNISLTKGNHSYATMNTCSETSCSGPGFAIVHRMIVEINLVEINSKRKVKIQLVDDRNF